MNLAKAVDEEDPKENIIRGWVCTIDDVTKKYLENTVAKEQPKLV